MVKKWAHASFKTPWKLIQWRECWRYNPVVCCDQSETQRAAIRILRASRRIPKEFWILILFSIGKELHVICNSLMAHVTYHHLFWIYNKTVKIRITSTKYDIIKRHEQITFPLLFKEKIVRSTYFRFSWVNGCTEFTIGEYFVKKCKIIQVHYNFNLPVI